MSSSPSTGSMAPGDSAIAFSGTIAPTRVSAAYRAGLIVVAVTMLLLPLLYVSLIALAGAAVWWHVTENTWVLRGSGTQWRVLVYAAPAIAGVVLMFFMIKPILARRPASREPVSLDADAEPALFALIGEICRQVRAPRPRRVYVDCSVNAAAGFLSGRLSLLRRDLVLTIGLPLVGGLSIRELAGVLAHEFGHFAQGGGMRLTAIVRGVNGWFGRVVYERDAWDVTLERWSKDADSRVAVVLVVAQIAVWVSRQALRILMLGGHAISCFMMRQMEYDADSYEIKIAGSDAFVRTSTRLRELNAAAHLAYGDVREGLRRGTLPIDLPAFMIARGTHVPPEVLTQIRSGDDTRTRLFDTHPSDADRIRAAEAADAPGVLVGADAPAATLIRHFEALGAAATRHHFEHDLGLSLDALTFIDTSTALHDSNTRAENLGAIPRFFGDRWSPYRPLHLGVRDVEPLSADELRLHLAAARQAMVESEPEASRLYAEFAALEQKRQKAFAAHELLSAGFTAVKAADFDLAEATTQAAMSVDERAREQQRVLEPTLEAFEAAAARRLSCAVILLRDVEGEPGARRDAVASLVDASNALASVVPDLRELTRLHIAAWLIEHNAPSSPWPPQTAVQMRDVDRRVAARRDMIRRGLGNVACPPEFAASRMTLAERCGLPPDGPFADAPTVIDRALKLYSEILGRLAAVALQLEVSLLAAGPSDDPGTPGSPSDK